ncbi:MAG: bifunctional diguanylate cyclase/phosphodiesterase [Bacillota bacterium]
MITAIGNIYQLVGDLLRYRPRGMLVLNRSINQASPVDKLKRVLAGDRPIGVIFLDIVKFHEIHQLQGSIIATRILFLLEDALRHRIAELLPEAGILAVEHLWADDFVVLVALEDVHSQEYLLHLAATLRSSLKEELNPKLVELVGSELELHLGCSVIEPRGNLKPDLKLYNALREAQRVAKGAVDLDTLRLKRDFEEIIENKNLKIQYQPVVSLSSGEILGWEALTRGPEGSHFSRPDIIFRFAEEVGLLFPTERVCREKAISNINGLGPEQKLFLNVHPRTMNDPKFVRGETLQLLQKYGLAPHNIVFEITERHSIKDYHFFKRVVEHYRSQGYRIAIDDVGAGFSGLQSIAEIRPDFIKIDMSLVRNIDSNPSRQAVVNALISLAGKINSRVIAEGVETQNELNVLLLQGAHFAQGYFLARPEFPKPAATKAVVAYIRRQRTGDLAGRRRNLCIGDLTVPALVVGEETPVSKAKELLDAVKQPNSGLLVIRGQETVGLVMRHNLHRTLSSQYGVPLYYRRPITAVMDRAPLVLEVHISLEGAAELAVNRAQDKLYDDLVVVDENRVLVGVVPVQRLLDTVTRMQIELAKGANPLTGLPGNVAIEEELSRRARHGQISSVIYADLDGFKAYNDIYGFEHGDQMIMLLSKVLLHSAKKYGTEEDFAGHIGGDDLIVITKPECAERISRKTVGLFDRLVGSCFSSEERARGAFYGYNRAGRQEWLPLTSVSLAIVDCQDHEDYRSLAETAAQLKKRAKALPGSVYVRDRRSKTAKTIVKSF